MVFWLAKSSPILVFCQRVFDEIACGARGRDVCQPIRPASGDRRAMFDMCTRERNWPSAQIASPTPKGAFLDPFSTRKGTATLKYSCVTPVLLNATVPAFGPFVFYHGEDRANE